MTQTSRDSTERRRLLTQLSIAGVGVLLSIVLHFVVPFSSARSLPQGDGWQFVWMHFVQSYFMEVVVFLGMVLFAIYRRGPRGWIFALVAGGLVPELLVFHWMK
jgi:hypothetical protein